MAQDRPPGASASLPAGGGATWNAAGPGRLAAPDAPDDDLAVLAAGDVAPGGGVYQGAGVTPCRMPSWLIMPRILCRIPLGRPGMEVWVAVRRACWQVWWELCTGCNMSSRPGWWQAGCRQVTRKSNGAIAPISEVWQERAMMVSCSGTQCAQMGCRCGLRTHLTALRPTGRHKPPKRGPRATLWTLCTKLAPEVRAPFRQTATVTLDM